ncbi:Dabb family protein [Dyadobacter diqingensis]|uniref:Dabb family protein n=1 Tax=Dyadobacter diqingensis TaxID=2938121 RepID=UPI0020C1A43A|nr:Dabb family protein [Dyadobacter diqingensis]
MIQHSVIFKLKYPKNSTEETTFLDAARALVSIPGVLNFQCLKQTSPKNNFDYGLTMEFESQQTYDAYSNHPDHTYFVQEFWLRDVEDFLEIDYAPF